jgi:predicted ATPase/class 3 adenylate cyclase
LNVGSLPRGTVTFVFTDIEGSTRLLHDLGEGYVDALAEHRRLLRRVFARNRGVEVDTQGDAFFVAFPSARDALAAAREGQAALTEGPVRVRMGVLTGEPWLTDEGYVGLDVHRAARIAAVGWGGQILVSGSTQALARLDELRDLGEHRLKDLLSPERIYQYGDGDFPPLRSLRQTNLPMQSAPLVGRREELSEVLALLRSHRLLTLTGAGGSGKTRLALHAAAELADEFPDGVWLVSLAAVDDPELVESTVAQAVGATEDIRRFLSSRHLLLVLDNLEHLLPTVASTVAALVGAAGVTVLGTSRERLNIGGEQQYPVPMLVVREAVALFATRARQLLPTFEPDEHVPDIVRRLDCLPLAIELAAARVSVLPPRHLLDRLERRLPLLTGGARDAPDRQRTLHATIDWSYDLLGQEEQGLVARLAVFAGSFSLEAAEHVSGANVDALASLVDKSLLHVAVEGRFVFLETIREYALERLDRSDDAAVLRRSHGEFFLAMAELAEAELSRARQAEWLDSLERDYANLRAVLAWSLSSDGAVLGLRMAGALSVFWSKRGYLDEGRQWLANLLGAPQDHSAARARGLWGAALLASLQGDWLETKRWSLECRQLSLELGDSILAAKSLLTLGRAVLGEGDAVAARSYFEEAAELAQASGQAEVVAMSRFNLGFAALSIGDFDRARREMEAAKGGFTTLGDRYGVARSLAALGSVAVHEGRVGEALPLLRESVTLALTLGDRDDIAWALQLLAVALSESRSERAARLLGAAEVLREALGARLEGIELALHEQTLPTLESRSDPETIRRARASGRNLSLEEAVDLALTEN